MVEFEKEKLTQVKDYEKDSTSEYTSTYSKRQPVTRHAIDLWPATAARPRQVTSSLVVRVGLILLLLKLRLRRNYLLSSCVVRRDHIWPLDRNEWLMLR